jgi:hypothetical protein
MSKPMTRKEMLKVCEDLEYKQPETIGQQYFNDGVEEAIRRLRLRAEVA